MGAEAASALHWLGKTAWAIDIATPLAYAALSLYEPAESHAALLARVVTYCRQLGLRHGRCGSVMAAATVTAGFGGRAGRRSCDRPGARSIAPYG